MEYLAGPARPGVPARVPGTVPNDVQLRDHGLALLDAAHRICHAPARKEPNSHTFAIVDMICPLNEGRDVWLTYRSPTVLNPTR